MRITKTFRRSLRTSRHYVFGNIMDLDHVCVLHKRWFRNLLIITRRPDYVEYRLQSRFYGLRQNTMVRGAPIDENRYWYEFLTALSAIRVEGLMEGHDGALTLTETISYSFHWALAPLFFLLKPLFRKQKEDILLADSRLLERVYRLDQAGFARSVQTDRSTVVVFGGSGFFGRLVVEDLLKYSDVNIIIAARQPKFLDFGSFRPRVTFVVSDLNNHDSVYSTIEGAEVAICCAGPYQGMSLNLLRACISRKVHYVDVADDRDFVERCHKLSEDIERARIMAFVGCSVVPGLSSLLTKFCRDLMPTTDTTRIFITPGTRHPRGTGSFLCLLSTLGTEFSIPSCDSQKLIKGWTGRQRIDFPPPLGSRWVYFVVDIPDYFLQQLYFGAKSVEFKIGAELDFLNKCLTGIRWAKERGSLKDLRRLAPLFRTFIYLASLFGTSQGAVMVEVSSAEGGPSQRASASVFSRERGETIPAILPSVAAQMILRSEIDFSGIISLPGWISREKLLAELANRHVSLALKKTASESWSLCC